MELDLTVFKAIQSLTGIALVDELMLFIAEVFVVVVPLVLVYLWFKGREGKNDSILTFSSAILGLLISYGMGLLYSHQNPSATLDTIVAARPENAFPSQHTAVIFSAMWPLFWRERKNLGIITLVAAISTGFARVYIGEHWPVDILGSIVASILGFGLIYLSKDYLTKVIEPVVDLGEKVEKKILSVSN